MKKITSAFFGLVAISACTMSGADPDSVAGQVEDPDLVSLMTKMQRHLHKLDLSVQAGNRKLGAFYVHELEEVLEEIVRNVPSYDDHPVAHLAESILEPRLNEVEKAIESGRDMTENLGQLIDACNACHTATDHAYIVIGPAIVNPFNQDFSRPAGAG